MPLATPLALVDAPPPDPVPALPTGTLWFAGSRPDVRLLPFDLRTDDLDAHLQQPAASGDASRVRAVYVTPHHQFPTTVTLTAARRRHLLDLAARHQFAIIEDDYDHEFHYDGRPVLPLASVDRSGLVIYIGTLSKVLAPGLRLGYIVAPRPIVERVAAHRSFVDTQGDQVVEVAVAQLLEEGAIQRHVQRVRRVYARRRDALTAALTARLADRLTFTVPSGGIALWVTARNAAGDIDAWAARARAHGLLFDTARQFDVDQRPLPSARLASRRWTRRN